MEVVISDSPARAAVHAADLVEDLVRRRPEAVLGLATGSSPVGVYAELARRVVGHGLSFARTTAFTLDEYLGLSEDHPERYRNVILRAFAGPVRMDPDQVHTPDDTDPDVEGACERYEADIKRSGGIDLQILGVGTDGHIAFKRARLVPGLEDQGQDPQRSHSVRQRTVLRRRRRRSA